MSQLSWSDRSESPRILVIGLSAAGPDSLPAFILERIQQAELLVGGRRHLSYFPEFVGSTLIIEAEIRPMIGRLQQALMEAERVVVLASGDPLCYGIGSTLRRYFPAEALEIIPAPTSFQLAFAALAESWHEATLLSAHARPLDQVISQTLRASKAAILTDNKHTPAIIAEALVKTGLDPKTSCAICENLGSAEQRIVRTDLEGAGQENFAPLNVFIVWPDSSVDLSPAASPSLPDASFETTAGQLTKREIRLLSLAELALQPGEIMWDIGAGSGAVSIEAARSQPLARVYAIEKRALMCRHIKENLGRFPAPNLRMTQGVAPDIITAWPEPDAVFIGGSGGRLEEILALIKQRLRPQGRLVINLVTLEHLYTVHRALPEARVIQIQINRGAAILDMLRFEALNPVFMVTWKQEV